MLPTTCVGTSSRLWTSHKCVALISNHCWRPSVLPVRLTASRTVTFPSKYRPRGSLTCGETGCKSFASSNHQEKKESDTDLILEVVHSQRKLVDVFDDAAEGEVHHLLDWGLLPIKCTQLTAFIANLLIISAPCYFSFATRRVRLVVRVALELDVVRNLGNLTKKCRGFLGGKDDSGAINSPLPTGRAPGAGPCRR